MGPSRGFLEGVPGSPKPPGFHTTAREPKRAHLRVLAFKNTTKNQREDTQRDRKRTKWEREREEKSEILGGGSGGGGVRAQRASTE